MKVHELSESFFSEIKPLPNPTDHRGRCPSARGRLPTPPTVQPEARGLMKSFVFAVERASSRSALDTKGVRWVPPTSAHLQRRLREPFAGCRIPKASARRISHVYFFLSFFASSAMRWNTRRNRRSGAS